jgi:hypothetical protein
MATAINLERSVGCAQAIKNRGDAKNHLYFLGFTPIEQSVVTLL